MDNQIKDIKDIGKILDKLQGHGVGDDEEEFKCPKKELTKAIEELMSYTYQRAYNDGIHDGINENEV